MLTVKCGSEDATFGRAVDGFVIEMVQRVECGGKKAVRMEMFGCESSGGDGQRALTSKSVNKIYAMGEGAVIDGSVERKAKGKAGYVDEERGR